MGPLLLVLGILKIAPIICGQDHRHNLRTSRPTILEGHWLSLIHMTTIIVLITEEEDLLLLHHVGGRRTRIPMTKVVTSIIICLHPDNPRDMEDPFLVIRPRTQRIIIILVVVQPPILHTMSKIVPCLRPHSGLDRTTVKTSGTSNAALHHHPTVTTIDPRIMKDLPLLPPTIPIITHHHPHRQHHHHTDHNKFRLRRVPVWTMETRARKEARGTRLRKGMAPKKRKHRYQHKLIRLGRMILS
jgi:hypothetical protein